jgi:uncharacterized protein YjiS (DUF1127 family)
MIFIDVVTDQPARSPIVGVLHDIAGWMVDAKARRKRTAALQDLLFMPEHRLRDLGLRREDVREALVRGARPAGPDQFN